MGSSSHAEWQLEQDRIVVAAGVLRALCPGSSACVSAGFVFIFCGGVFIRLPEGSGHHLYCRNHPGAFGEFSTWVMCRSRWKVLVQHWSSCSLPSVPALPLCLSTVTRGHWLPEPTAAGDAPRMTESTVRMTESSHPALHCTLPFPAPSAARAPKPQETSNKRLFELDVKA